MQDFGYWAATQKSQDVDLTTDFVDHAYLITTVLPCVLAAE